jgi:hypothetical protein
MRYQPPSVVSRWEARAEQREQTAFHEAAHGVAVQRYGFHAYELKLFERGAAPYFGICRWRSGPKLTLAAEIVIALAGEASDRKFFGQPYGRIEGICDCARAQRAATKLASRYGVKVDHVLRAGRLVAFDLVTQFKPEIERLANALVARGVLDGDQIGDIIGSVKPIATAPLIGTLIAIDDTGVDEGDDEVEEADDQQDDEDEKPPNMPKTTRQGGDTVFIRNDGVLLSSQSRSYEMRAAPTRLRFVVTDRNGVERPTSWSFDRDGTVW